MGKASWGSSIHVHFAVERGLRSSLLTKLSPRADGTARGLLKSNDYCGSLVVNLSPRNDANTQKAKAHQQQ